MDALESLEILSGQAGERFQDAVGLIDTDAEPLGKTNREAGACGVSGHSALRSRHDPLSAP